MWALVDDSNNVTNVYGTFPPKITINDRNYDGKELKGMSEVEKNAIKIYEVTTASRFNENYYINNNPTYALVGTKVVETITKAADKVLTDVNEVWTQKEIDDGYAPDGTSANDAKNDEDGNQIVTLGLKSNAKNKITTQANGYLQGFDWLIQRKVTAEKAIPSVVLTYMAAIRTDHASIVAALDGAADMAAFIALHTTTHNEDGTVNVIAKTQSWTSDANVRQFRR